MWLLWLSRAVSLNTLQMRAFGRIVYLNALDAWAPEASLPTMNAFLIFATWIASAYAFRSFLVGDPAQALVRAAPEPLVTRAMAFMDAPSLPEDESLAGFLRRFYRIRLVNAIVFGLEVAVIIHFLVVDPLFPITWFLLIVKLFFYLRVNRNPLAAVDDEAEEADDNPLAALLEVPAWLQRWQRAGHLLAAICYLVLCLRIADLV